MVYLCPSFRPSFTKLYYDSTSIQVVIGPLEKNFASSFANMLRRIVLRYTPGMGIVGLKINSVPRLHLYSTMNGIKENISEIITNIKMINIETSSIKSASLFIKKKGPCILRAKDIECPEGINILNKNLYLANIEFNTEFNATLYAELGCGYVPASYHGYEKNVLFCDTIFSPIKHVSYNIRSYSTYEELIFYIKTNKGCDPLFAFENAMHFLNNKTKFPSV